MICRYILSNFVNTMILLDNVNATNKFFCIDIVIKCSQLLSFKYLSKYNFSNDKIENESFNQKYC